MVMKRKILSISLAAFVVVFFTSCPKDPEYNPELDEVWKTGPTDKDGNIYESGKMTVDVNGDGTDDYTQEILMQNLQTDADPDGNPKFDGDGNLQVGCYIDIKSNCTDQGALYSLEKTVGKTVQELVTENKSKGDADGDGFLDSSVEEILRAAGYDPAIYTITPAVDPLTGDPVVIPPGLTDVTTGNAYDPKSNITYVVTKTGDTVYTPGANGKILVPDLSKIDLLKLKVVQGPQGTCMEGWHIPSDAEFKLYETLKLGMTTKEANMEGIEYDRGRKDNSGAKMVVDLNIKYGGYWSSNKTYAQRGEVEVFWTGSGGTDANGKSYVWIRYIDTLAHKGIIRKKHYDQSAFGVRCFKN